MSQRSSLLIFNINSNSIHFLLRLIHFLLGSSAFKGKRKKSKSRLAKKKKNGKTGDVSKPFLPLDVIMEILSRLPIHSLIRFQSVSKQWANLHSDPCFINAHAHQAHSKPGLIFCAANEGDNPGGTLIFFDVETMEERSLPFQPKKESTNDNDNVDGNITISASCNGLVLVQRSNCYYVYNPVTELCMAIPPPPDDCGAFRLWSLAYDSMNMEFKVVCSMKCAVGYVCYVFTIGNEGDSWRELPIPSPHCLYNFPPVLTKGYLHWMIHSIDLENMEGVWISEPESEGCILTMDVSKEVFFKTSHPKSVNGVYTMLDLNGHLCFVDHVSNTQLKFWVLKDLGEQEDWIEECSLHIKEGDYPFGLSQGFLVDLYPLAILGQDGKYKIIIKCNTDLFFSYEVGAEKWTKLPIDHLMSFNTSFEEMYSPIRHTNSLFGVGRGRS